VPELQDDQDLNFSDEDPMRRLYRQLLFATASIAVGSAVILVGLELIFRVLPTSDSLMMQPVNANNTVLRFAPNRTVLMSRGRAFHLAVEKRVNNDGFVNDQHYDRNATTPLLAVIGDSYVEATQVKHVDTFHGILAERVSDRGRVYSFGASGAQLPTYLTHAKYAVEEYGASALVFVIIGNDFDESLLFYKSAAGFHYYRGSTNDALELTRIDYAPTKLKTLARKSALIRYLVLNLEIDFAELLNRIVHIANSTVDTTPRYVGNTSANADAVRLTRSKKAIDTFLTQVGEISGLEGDLIVFAVDGIRPQLYAAADLAETGNSYFARMRRYFMIQARERGYRVIDLQAHFIARHETIDERFEFEQDHHWNAAGHRVVAEAIADSEPYRTLLGVP